MLRAGSHLASRIWVGADTPPFLAADLSDINGPVADGTYVAKRSCDGGRATGFGDIPLGLAAELAGTPQFSRCPLTNAPMFMVGLDVHLGEHDEEVSAASDTVSGPNDFTFELKK